MTPPDAIRTLPAFRLRKLRLIIASPVHCLAMLTPVDQLPGNPTAEYVLLEQVLAEDGQGR